MKQEKCGTCSKFKIEDIGISGYAPCFYGGYRKDVFPQCDLYEPRKRIHNDDVNMFSKTDVKDDINN